MDKDRNIWLQGEINSVSAIKTILQLLDYNNESETEEINIYINSPGGSIIYGLAIYDTIKHIKAPVCTICYGMAASMGAFLLSCGKKGKRAALKHSRILIHQPLISSSQGMYRTQSDIQRMAEELLKSRNELETIMAGNTGKSLEQLSKDCERDNWMSAEEALEYHLIDEIL